jgi:hypothetical protein
MKGGGDGSGRLWKDGEITEERRKRTEVGKKDESITQTKGRKLQKERTHTNDILRPPVLCDFIGFLHDHPQK